MVSVPSSVAFHLTAPATRRGGHRRNNPSWPSPLNPIQDVPCTGHDVLAAAPGTMAMQHSPSNSTLATNTTGLSGSTSTSSLAALDSAGPRPRSGPSSSTPAKVDPTRALVPVVPMPWVRLRAGTNESALTRASLGSLPGLSACSSASLSDHAGPIVASASPSASASARHSAHSLQVAATADSDATTLQSVYQPRLITLDLRIPVAGSPPAYDRKSPAQSTSDSESPRKLTPSAMSSSGTPTPHVFCGERAPKRAPSLSRLASSKVCSTSDVSSDATTSTPVPGAARAARAVAAMIPRLGWSTSPRSVVTQIRMSPGSAGSTASHADGMSTVSARHGRIRAVGPPRASPPTRSGPGPSSPRRSKGPSSETELLPWHPTFGMGSDTLAVGSVGSDA